MCGEIYSDSRGGSPPTERRRLRAVDKRPFEKNGGKYQSDLEYGGDTQDRNDGDHRAPVLWRSEFRSVLRQYIMTNHMVYSDAVWIAEKAEGTMRGKEYAVQSAAVLKLVERTGRSRYDCEYVALAEAHGLQLVTGDGKVARLFPKVAILLEDFVG